MEPLITDKGQIGETPVGGHADLDSALPRKTHTLLWSAYSRILEKIHASGILGNPLGKRAFAIVNRGARVGLRAYLTLIRNTINIRGHRMRLAHRDSSNLGLTLKMLLGVYETGTTLLMERILKPGMVVIDVGAHVGYYALLAARLVGQEGRVYAFEADPANYRLLSENIELNSYSNLHAFSQAVTDHSGQLSFFLSPFGSDRNSLYAENTGGGAREVQVTAIALDEFIASVREAQIDLIKMDIEGAELAALEGMKETIKRTVRLIVEYSPLSMREKPEQLLNKLSELGFRISVISNDGNLEIKDLGEFSALTECLICKKDCVNLFCEKTYISQCGYSTTKSEVRR
jgi:FkbM family methyltransferase